MPSAEFIHPIPVRYLRGLTYESKKFGLATEKKEMSFRAGSWQLTGRPRRISTIEEKREVIRWLAERLRAVGRPLDRTIVVRMRIVQIDISSNDEINSETSFQYEINLDDYNS